MAFSLEGEETASSGRQAPVVELSAVKLRQTSARAKLFEKDGIMLFCFHFV